MAGCLMLFINRDKDSGEINQIPEREAPEICFENGPFLSRFAMAQKPFYFRDKVWLGEYVRIRLAA